MKSNNKHLLHLVQAERRPKPATNAIGRFANWEFGSMDNEDAAQQLLILQLKESQAFNLLHQQTTVMATKIQKTTQSLQNLTAGTETVKRHLLSIKMGF